MGVGPLFDFKKNLWFKFFFKNFFLKIFGKKPLALFLLLLFLFYFINLKISELKSPKF